MISIYSQISDSFSPLSKYFGDRPKCTNFNWYDRHPLIAQLLSSFAKTKYLSLSLLFFFKISTCCQLEWLNCQNCKFFSFFSFYFKTFLLALDLIFWPQLDYLFVSQNSRYILCISFPGMHSGLCIYHLVRWSKYNVLHNSHWITFPTQSCLLWYSLCIS